MLGNRVCCFASQYGLSMGCHLGWRVHGQLYQHDWSRFRNQKADFSTLAFPIRRSAGQDYQAADRFAPFHSLIHSGTQPDRNGSGQSRVRITGARMRCSLCTTSQTKWIRGVHVRSRIRSTVWTSGCRKCGNTRTTKWNCVSLETRVT